MPTDILFYFIFNFHLKENLVVTISESTENAICAFER